MTEHPYQSLPIYVFSKDLNSRFLGCNFAFARAAGLKTPAEIIGKNDRELIWADTHANYFQETDRAVMDGVAHTSILESIARPAGQIITIMTNKLPLHDAHGQLIGVYGNYIDMSDLKFNRSAPNEIKKLFSRRHIECLYRLVRGYTSAEIAEELGLSRRTVEHYIDNIKGKLGCRRKSDLIRKALKFDYIKNMLLISS